MNQNANNISLTNECMQEYFTHVESALKTQAEVDNVHPSGNITEVNKVPSTGFVGGAYERKFSIELTEEARPEPWKLDNTAASLHNNLQKVMDSVLTKDDAPVRTINISTIGTGEDREIIAKAYIIPDPE